MPQSSSSRPLSVRARDFVLYRVRILRGWLKHTLRQRLAQERNTDGPLRLHVGCGSQALDGWVNLDIQKLPEVDVALDVRAGLPFEDAELVFAEHFLEHLQVDVALDFLRDIHGALADDGWVRLSTPNLDWVWNHVFQGQRNTRSEQIGAVIDTNRAFYGWRHRFLWDRVMLEEALEASGFIDLCFCRYGESPNPALRDLERHPKSSDSPEMPHVLIVEARKGSAQPDAFASLQKRLADDFIRHRDVL